MGNQSGSEPTAKWRGELWASRSDRWRGAAGDPIYPQTWHLDSCEDNAQKTLLSGKEIL